MRVVCPKCKAMLGSADVNVVTDVAQCSLCEEVFPLSRLIEAVTAASVDLDNPPWGSWYQSEYDGFAVGATTRNPLAFFLVPFMCVWSGFSLGGIYGTQIVSGKFSLLGSLFGLPFLAGTVIFGTVALMAVFGKVVVRVANGEGEVFTGIGPLGWNRTFSVVDVKNIRVEVAPSRNNRSLTTIVLDGPRKLRFGSLLNENRRDFMANALRRELLVKGAQF